MVRSMRWRLVTWYAVVLTAVIAGFALTLYVQASRAAFTQIDEQLIGAGLYLEATLRQLPPPDAGPGDGRPPRDGGPIEGRPPREGGAFEGRPPPDGGPRDGRPPREGGPLDGRPPRDREPPPFGGPPPRRGGGPPGRPPGPRGEGRGEGRDGPPNPERVRERVMNDLKLPSPLAPGPDELPEDAAYFVVWRSPDTVLKSSPELSDATFASLQVVPDSMTRQPRLRQRGARREIVQLGPRESIILVGKPIARELNDLTRLGRQLAGSGCLALAVGLAGGWLISRGIVTPIARISTTAGAISAANLSGRIETERLDTELVGLAEVLNQMFSRLEAEFARQSRFTADASHELRTPLALLLSQIELALKRPRSADDYREALETCRRAAERMRSLTDSLLTLARADAGRLALVMQPIGLGELIAETVESFEITAEESQVKLIVGTSDRTVMIQGDPIFLSRVLANLLNNALRHTPAGGTVDVSFGTEDHHAWFSVADTGSGIPLNDQPRIFERFFRADKARSRSSGGSGLGLAICKSIVEAHSGQISFTSTPGHGSVFSVRLPLSTGKAEGTPVLSIAG